MSLNGCPVDVAQWQLTWSSDRATPELTRIGAARPPSRYVDSILPPASGCDCLAGRGHAVGLHRLQVGREGMDTGGQPGADGGGGGDGDRPDGAPVVAPAAGLCGWAAVAGDGVTTTTGAGEAPPITVTTAEELLALAEDPEPRVIQIDGMLDAPALDVASNKTIVGVGPSSGIAEASASTARVSPSASRTSSSATCTLTAPPPTSRMASRFLCPSRLDRPR